MSLWCSTRFDLKVGDKIASRPSFKLGSNCAMATKEKGMALARIPRLNSDIELLRTPQWDGKKWGSKDHVVMIENFPDAFKILDDTKGFLAEVKGDFKEEAALKGTALNWASPTDAEVVKITAVTDLRKALIEAGVILVSHEQKIKAITQAYLG